jgi:hypothetical protein
MTDKPRQWYREPWPWILMAGPAAVVVAGFITAWLAATTEDGLVDDDYYKKGLAINQTLERDQAANALQIRAQLMVGADVRQVRIMLQGGGQGTLPQTLRLKVLHPTRSGMDHVVSLSQRGEGYYEGHLDELGDAKWRLILEDTDNRWRLTGTWHVPRDSVVMLQSKG